MISDKKILIIFLVLIFLSGSTGCKQNREIAEADKGGVIQKEDPVPDDDKDLIPVTVGNVIGKWNLIYADNYGYSFSFFKNYKALIIIYLKTSAIIFKGVFTIEEKSIIRVNIIEMKHEESVQNMNFNRDFVKTQKSYFLFKGNVKEKDRKKSLIVKPEKIIIDGSNSEGYFEPVIKLEVM